ncbi:MAG TPA: BRO family protein [Saprospiraceae bacterium]|nr:BRO family protein [Saprospiraceae bacterium]
MKKKLSNAVTPPIFEQIKRLDENGTEYWSARDLSKVLEYSEYRHFLPALERAKEACQNSGQQMADHFEDILEMVTIGSKAERQIENIKLSRYACYLIVQNADPSKEVVALGQTHFEVGKKVRQTIQELGGEMPENLPIEESIKKVEKNLPKTGKKKKLS